MPAKSSENKDILNKGLKNGISSRLRDIHNSSLISAKNCDPPALELDVYITEDKMEKLVVFKNDIPELVADQFCKKYNLDNEKKVLLISVIKDQVSKVLTCISEEDEDFQE
jgi:hypothetical protein